jgi:hypothetical protein
MARASISPQVLDIATNVTLSPATADGISFAASDRSVLMVSVGATPVNLTILAKKPYIDGTLKDLVKPLAANGVYYFKPFSGDFAKFLSTGTGKVEVDFSVVTNVSYALISI